MEMLQETSGSGTLDCGWNFSWDEGRVSDEEDREVGAVMTLDGSLDEKWSEVVFSGEENTLGKGGDAGSVWNFGETVGELREKSWHFG